MGNLREISRIECEKVSGGWNSGDEYDPNNPGNLPQFQMPGYIPEHMFNDGYVDTNGDGQPDAIVVTGGVNLEYDGSSAYYDGAGRFFVDGYHCEMSNLQLFFQQNQDQLLMTGALLWPALAAWLIGEANGVEGMDPNFVNAVLDRAGCTPVN